MASVETAPRAAARRKAKRAMRPLPAVVAIGLLGLAGWWGWTKTHPAVDPKGNLITAKVTKGDLTETVSATGSVTAQTGAQVKIGSQITGRIKRLYADVGSTVKAGQVIAELDLPDIQAQVSQAQANLAMAQMRLDQQRSGVGMQRTQTSSAVSQAQADLQAARARLSAAQASLKQQVAQTPTDITRAQTSLGAVQAALSTARSNLQQTQAGADLQVANAQEQLNQAQANQRNSATNLTRQQNLLAKGFVAASVVDDARAAADVDRSRVTAARQNLDLVKQKVAADLQAAKDQVTQAQQNVESAKAALESAKAGQNQDAVKLANVNEAREAVRQAEAALRIARGNTAQNTLKQQDVQQAQDAVRAAQAQLDFNRAQLDKTFIHSPISGTVLQMAAQQGETLAAGLSAPTLIVVADLNRLQVDAFVDETDIGKIKLGQEASITVDAFPKRPFKGRVIKVASGSTIQQGVVTYDVSFAIEDRRHVLKPDMTASVQVETRQIKDVLLVPAEAVKLGVRGATVNVLKPGAKDAEPEVRKVKTGASDGVNTEIRDGLKEGETIVLAGMSDGRQRGMGPQSPFGPSGGGRGGGGGGRGGGGGGGRRG